MVSSVAIDDELRRKLKILAAKYDTTQSEIIKQAIKLFEGENSVTNKYHSPEIRKILERVSERVYEANPRRKRVALALNRPGVNIDDLRVEFGIKEENN